MFNLFNRLSGTTAHLLVVGAIIGVILMGFGFYGVIGFGWMGLALGSAAALSLTAAFAKQDDEDDDNWAIGFTAVANFLLVYGVLVNLPAIIAHDFAWALALTVIGGVALLYTLYPNWWVWPIALLLGGRICGVGGAMLYLGLTTMRYLNTQNVGKGWLILCFVVTAVMTFVWVVGTLHYIEWKAARGLGKLRSTIVPGDAFCIHRKKRLAYICANTDSVPRTELTEEQMIEVRRFIRAEDFDGLEAYAIAEHLEYDPRWDIDTYTMELPNIWRVPYFATIPTWLVKFDVAHSGDHDHANGGDHDEHAESGEPEPTMAKWVHATLEIIADIDVEKTDVGTGLRSSPVAVMTGVNEMYIARPRRFFRVGKAWRHHLDTARDLLVTAICSKVGPRIIAASGHSVFDLVQGFQIQVGTAFGNVQEFFQGVPEVEADINAYGHTLEHMGIFSTPVVFKWVVPSGQVETARGEMTKAAGAAEVAAVVLNARLVVVEQMLMRLIPNDPARRAEVMAAILPAMVLDDRNGIMNTLTTLGVASNAAQGVANAARGNQGGGGNAGGARGGNAGGGGNNP